MLLQSHTRGLRKLRNASKAEVDVIRKWEKRKEEKKARKGEKEKRRDRGRKGGEDFWEREERREGERKRKGERKGFFV